MPVYEPQEDSELLLAVVEKEARGAVLDMGAGSGILSLAAARKADVASVLAVDVDPDAVEHVKRALEPEKPEIMRKVQVLTSDLFKEVPSEELFDTIICNPPYLPDEESDSHPALYGGAGGWEYIERFLIGAKGRLKPDGVVLLLFSSLSNEERVLAAVKREGYSHKEVAMSAHFFERLYVYRLWRRSDGQ